MNVNTFAAFLTVVEEMSFTKAAQRLYVTQQSLSGQIKRLEEEFGVTLFERRPVLRMTPEGEKMFFYAQQMLRMQDAIINDFADVSKSRRAFLYVGITYMRSIMFSSGIWERFNDLHPNIQVRLMENTTARLLERLQRGEIMIMIGVDIAPVPGIRVIPLMREYPCCIVSRELYAKYCIPEADRAEEGISQENVPAAGEAAEERAQKDLIIGGEISVRQLGEVPIIFPGRGNRLRYALDQMYRTAGVRPRVLFESERQDVMAQLACDGKGAAIVSPMVLYDSRKHKLRLPEDCHVFRIREVRSNAVSMAYMENFHLPGHAEEMMNIIRETFDEYAKWIGTLGLGGPDTP